jgi:hypothetical protein
VRIELPWPSVSRESFGEGINARSFLNLTPSGENTDSETFA